mmetsp:Transcript_6307/g.10256  ORF Transcript_6307/g.10256 Transcript_6307/m.10256 type:complete len:178 (+) Transcript_6307:1295-1828(+)
MDDKFNVPQLNSLVMELKMLADEEENIQNRVAIELFVRKSQNSKFLGDNGGLPKDWSNFSQTHFEKMVRNLDIDHIGCINYKVLATCCILLQSQLPDLTELDRMLGKIKVEYLNQEQFSTINFWFSKSEESKDREYSHSFPRSQLIKEILYQLHADPEGVNMQRLGHFFKLDRIRTP